MKQDTLDKALELKERIEHIKNLIEFLVTYTYRCSPPARFCSFLITDFSLCDEELPQISLSEGEVEFIKTCLLQELGKLEKEFERL